MAVRVTGVTGSIANKVISDDYGLSIEYIEFLRNDWLIATHDNGKEEIFPSHLLEDYKRNGIHQFRAVAESDFN